MRRLKMFGSRPKGDSDTPSSPLCFPQFYSPARDVFHRRRSVDGRVADAATGGEGGATTAGGGEGAMRRRSVDDSRSKEKESVDLQAVRKEWKSSSSSAVSSSDSFNSSLSSSRPSDASAVSSDTIRDSIRDSIRGEVGREIRRVVVVGFDANARESGVGFTAMWAFRNTGLQRGDVLALFGVVDTVRGPLGYKVQVNDQTWLGARKKFLEEDLKVKTMAWSREFPVLQKRATDAGVSLQVDVRAAPRVEVAIVREATARGAVHVVLDKSLPNKRRHYYLDQLACDLTRMRHNGGVDAMRARSVLPQQQPPLPAEGENHRSWNSNLSRLVNETSGNKSESAVHSKRRQSSNPTIDEDELFCIDHDFLTRRVEMLLEPEPDLGENCRRDQLIVDEGYESDDLFSLAGDGASRRPSLAVFALESARNSLRSSMSRVAHVAAG